VNELLFSVDLLGPETAASKAAALLYLSREAMKKNQIDELWKTKRATSPKSLGDVLRSDAVIESIRKELRRNTGYRMDLAEIRRLLEETVLRPECLE